MNEILEEQVKLQQMQLLSLDDIIKFPISVTKDPQGTSALMYYSQLWKDGKLYNVEVLYDQTSNTIMHFLYTRESLGSLTKLK